LHTVLLQVLEKAGHLALGGGHGQNVRTFEVFGKQGEIPPIRLAGERAQTLLNPQIRNVMIDDAVGHKLDYLLPVCLIDQMPVPGIKRDSLSPIDEPFTPQVQNCCRSPTI
jgi:hypothetical protein